MIKKKNKFFTGVFSLIPGAGQMFMGFMKQGLSIMTLFSGIIFFSSWLNIGPLIFVLPVLWFYSFFDAINKMALDDEEFYAQEDSYLLSIDKFFHIEKSIFEKRNLFLGIIITITGVYLIWTNFLSYLGAYMSQRLYYALASFSNIFPQLTIGFVILILGIRMIVGKKKESAEND